MLRRLAIRYVGRDGLRELRDCANTVRSVIRAAWTNRKRRPVPVEEIIRGLKEVGVEPGDILLLHSAIGTLSRSGPHTVDNFRSTSYGRAVLDSVLNLLGPKGTLLVPTAPPTLAYDLATRAEIFDPRNAPAGTGLIPNLVLALPDSVRSPVPWQNISAAGYRAKELIEGHEQCGPYAMGPGSPWQRLGEMGGKVALLAVDHDRSSTVHVLENNHQDEYPRSVFFNKPHRFHYRAKDGSERSVDSVLHAVQWEDGDIVRFCRSVDKRYKIYREYPLGNTKVISFSAQAQYEAFLAEMEANRCLFDSEFRLP